MKKIWIQVLICCVLIILGIVAMYIFHISTMWKIVGYIVAGVLTSINILVAAYRKKYI
ncbi:hypothetical protein OSC52_06970 [Clostridium pasteurianum]|uniref:hypothetical protein n=1 Tax=Clostridium pasteurianum TaxID=1501 RepID=UPI002260D834|nr:hypothetical protein [Clostridium pasteurianum]UZW15574.1 hypothetical protein OSC52_06970 [Clostridium pasteurianum]